MKIKAAVGKWWSRRRLPAVKIEVQYIGPYLGYPKKEKGKSKTSKLLQLSTHAGHAIEKR